MRGFSSNPEAFHAEDGSGYAFVADMVTKLDDINPQVAADTVKPLTKWRRYDAASQAKMKDALQKVLEKPNLSKNVSEIIAKSLATDEPVKQNAAEKTAPKAKKQEAFMNKTPVKKYVSGADNHKSNMALYAKRRSLGR